MSRRKVLVKRLVCIEDLGDVDVLFTDKTGTLTMGRIEYMRAVPAGGHGSEAVVRWGLLSTENAARDAQDIGGNPLDQALWRSPAAAGERAALEGYTQVAVLPFDHDRRMISVLVRDRDGCSSLVTKGAPETVLDRCVEVPPGARDALAAEFAAGNRVVAVATRPVDPGTQAVGPEDERGLNLAGLLVFLDPPKPEASTALRRLSDLGIAVKVVTGDNAAVAAKVCHDL
ncbi:HAD family hydrolase [Streptomyces mirabilis]|uniref:HAD family hydrolase n=1 Tax=Streptomyces mirabilis TaxID=68239 RepID=UPI00331FB186